MYLFRVKSLLAVTAAACVLLAGPATRAQAQAAKKKLLVVTLCKGFRHSSIPTAEKVLAALGDKTGEWTCDYARTDDEVKAKMSPEGLKAYDAVCYANNTGLMPVPDRDAFVQWVKDGHALCSMHAGCDLMGKGEEWPEFLQMLGGQFRVHHQQCEITAIVNDRKHPANAGFTDNSWHLMKEEIYLLRNVSLADLHILLSLNAYPMDGDKMAGKPGWLPISWCRDFGKGHVFLTVLGHNESVWNDPTYEAHICGGIEWALGLKPGDATPQAKTGLWVTE